MQFGKSKKSLDLLYSWPAIIVFLLVFVLLAQSVWERYSVEKQMSARFEAAVAEYERLEEQRTRLSQRVEYLQGERGVEEELRRNFDVARPGEQVVILTGEAPVEAATTVEQTTSTPWYIFWRN